MLAESVQSNFLPMRRFGGPWPPVGLKFPTRAEFWTTDQAWRGDVHLPWRRTRFASLTDTAFPVLGWLKGVFWPISTPICCLGMADVAVSSALQARSATSPEAVVGRYCVVFRSCPRPDTRRAHRGSPHPPRSIGREPSAASSICRPLDWGLTNPPKSRWSQEGLRPRPHTALHR